MVFRNARHRSCRQYYRIQGLLACAVFFLVLLGGPQFLAAREAKVAEVVVTNSSTDILLYLAVRDAFTPAMEKGVQNGIPVTFTFFVELYRKRRGWFDEKITAATFDHTLTYDTLKEEYRIEYGELQAKVMKTKSLVQARDLMTQVNGFAVSPLSALVADREYLLRVKARLAEKTLPLYFHYLIPFWSLWDFETDWYAVDFRY